MKDDCHCGESGCVKCGTPIRQPVKAARRVGPRQHAVEAALDAIIGALTDLREGIQEDE